MSDEAGGGDALYDEAYGPGHPRWWYGGAEWGRRRKCRGLAAIAPRAPLSKRFGGDGGPGAGGIGGRIEAGLVFWTQCCGEVPAHNKYGLDDDGVRVVVAVEEARCDKGLVVPINHDGVAYCPAHQFREEGRRDSWDRRWVVWGKWLHLSRKAKQRVLEQWGVWPGEGRDGDAAVDGGGAAA